jgi:hypothetical protein
MKVQTKFIALPIQVPIGPNTSRVTGSVIINVRTGLKKYCIDLGTILSRNLFTYPIKAMAKIIGKNELE